jgi:hypothetical protein
MSSTSTFCGGSEMSSLEKTKPSTFLALLAAMNQFAIVFGERFFAPGLAPAQKDKNQ